MTLNSTGMAVEHLSLSRSCMCEDSPVTKCGTVNFCEQLRQMKYLDGMATLLFTAARLYNNELYNQDVFTSRIRLGGHAEHLEGVDTISTLVTHKELTVLHCVLF